MLVKESKSLGAKQQRSGHPEYWGRRWRDRGYSQRTSRRQVGARLWSIVAGKEVLVLYVVFYWDENRVSWFGVGVLEYLEILDNLQSVNTFVRESREECATVIKVLSNIKVDQDFGAGLDGQSLEMLCKWNKAVWGDVLDMRCKWQGEYGKSINDDGHDQVVMWFTKSRFRANKRCLSFVPIYTNNNSITSVTFVILVLEHVGETISLRKAFYTETIIHSHTSGGKLHGY